MPLSKESIAIVKATAPVVAQHALEMTSTFYKFMFTNNPEVLRYFNKQNQKKGRQQQALADAVIAYATNIEHLERLGGLVARMAHRHCALSVTPNLYQIVHDNLMQAIGAVLKDAVTPEIGAAWSEAVMALAEIAISAEEELYKANESRLGGWRLEREFVVKSKTTVASDTIRFEFVAADGYDGGFEFQAGQYLTVRCEGLTCAPRHYTIVSKSGDKTLAICTRKLQGGEISTYMHEKLQPGDKVLLGAPSGVFVVDPEVDDSVVFITAGIGATPAIAMAQALPADAVKATLHIETNASRDIVSSFYGAAGFQDKATVAYTQQPRLPAARPDMQKLISSITKECGSEATYVVCGPLGFMADVQAILISLGCTDVRTEVFGTGKVAPSKQPVRKSVENSFTQLTSNKYAHAALGVGLAAAAAVVASRR